MCMAPCIGSIEVSTIYMYIYYVNFQVILHNNYLSIGTSSSTSTLILIIVVVVVVLFFVIIIAVLLLVMAMKLWKGNYA